MITYHHLSRLRHWLFPKDFVTCFQQITYINVYSSFRRNRTQQISPQLLERAEGSLPHLGGTQCPEHFRCQASSCAQVISRTDLPHVEEASAPPVFVGVPQQSQAATVFDRLCRHLKKRPWRSIERSQSSRREQQQGAPQSSLVPSCPRQCHPLKQEPIATHHVRSLVSWSICKRVQTHACPVPCTFSERILADCRPCVRPLH